MPLRDHKEVNFDYDLDFGKVGEKFIEEAFEGDGSIEIKTERNEGLRTQWRQTGNIAIEYGFKKNMSGISTTNAKTWIQLLSDTTTDKDGKQSHKIVGGFIIQVSELKALIKRLKKEGTLRTTKGGDNKESFLALIPIEEMITCFGKMRL